MIKLFRVLAKLFDLPVLINRDFDNSISFEYFYKDESKFLSIDFLSILDLSNFVLFSKYIGQGKHYKKYIEVELPWIYLFYYELYK